MIQKLIIPLVLLSITNLFSQNICDSLNNYDLSQNWIKNVRNLDSEHRKDSILKLIKCDRKYYRDETRFKLTTIVNGYILSNFNIDRDDILHKINSENFEITNSMCENDGFYPQKCGLGTLLIKIGSNAILDEIQTIDLSKTKTSKKSHKIYLQALDDKKVEIITENFDDGKNKILKELSLKKGKNLITIPKTKNVLMITIINNKKSIVLIK